MRHLLMASLLAAALGSSSGCCIIDRIFHCPCSRWSCGGAWGECGPCSAYQYGADPSCGPCGGCGDGCSSCGGNYSACNSGGCMGCQDCECPYGANTPPSGPYARNPMYAQGGGGCPGGMCRRGNGPNSMAYAEPGPPTGGVAYPYYTTRGPRDFLARNPGNIGR